MLQIYGPACQDSSPLNIPVPLFALDASDEHLPAHIQTIGSGTVQFRIKSPLGSGRQLVMQYEGRRTELEVISCREEAGTYYIDCQIKSSKEGAVRSDWRMAVNWPAKVEVPPSKRTRRARVRDISVFGLGIQLDFKPELNSLLFVHMRSGVGLGRVKHYRCIAQNCYFAGLYLEEFRSKEQNVQQSGSEDQASRSLGCLLRQVVQSFTDAVARLK
jgi:hypothetical protein